MASIEDFVSHRWDDAREELRRLDSVFVGKLENDVRLDRLGLISPPTERDYRHTKTTVAFKVASIS